MSTDNMQRDLKALLNYTSDNMLVLTPPQTKSVLPVIDSFVEYDKQVGCHAKYPGIGDNAVYPSMKLAGEAGELADKIGKHWRNHNADAASKGNAYVPMSVGMSCITMPSELKLEIVKEVGDVLWYLNAICKELGVTLGYAAYVNADKLNDRAERGTILSRGDNR